MRIRKRTAFAHESRTRDHEDDVVLISALVCMRIVSAVWQVFIKKQPAELEQCVRGGKF